MSMCTKIATSTLILAMSSAVLAATESPSDYAYGAKLEYIDNTSAFHKIQLPEAVYQQTLSPNLDDVRVFNNNGYPVTFALINEVKPQSTIEPMNLDIYQLNKEENSEQNIGKYSVSINGNKTSIYIDNQLENNEPAGYLATYILKLPNNQPAQSLSSFTFNWQPTDYNWHAKTQISYSSDLKNWKNLVYNEPLMTLTNNDGSSLELNEININSYHYSYAKGTYWLVTIMSKNPIPKLSSVFATNKAASTQNATIAFNFKQISANNDSATYQLPSPQPLSALSIELQQDRTVQPIEIYYKTDITSDNWVKLEDRIIRRIDSSDTTTPFALSPRLPVIQAIQLKAINGSWEQAPEVQGLRHRIGLVFNSSNNGPFLLAWGSAQAKAVAISQQSLIHDQELDNIDTAQIGATVVLSGDKALQQNNDSQSSGFPQWIIWLCLIAGAGLLILLAYKLSQEIKKTE